MWSKSPAPVTHISLALVALLGSVSCAPGDTPGAGEAYTVRDSMGIEIVDVMRPQWTPGQGWTVSPEPVVDIGEMEGDEAYQLFRVTTALRLANGSIVITNRGTQELRWYDSGGRHVRNAGGEGGGPGEFDSLFGMSIDHDTLHAHDFRTARITVYDSAGALVRTVQLDRAAGLPLEIWPATDGYIGYILATDFDVSPDLTYSRRAAHYVRYGPDGSVRDSILELPGVEFMMRGGPVDDGFVMTSTTPLIGHSSQQTVVGGRLVAGITDRFEIRIYGEEGSLERLVRDPARDLPVSAGEWDEVIGEAMAEAEMPAQRRAVQEAAELRPPPATRPVWARFVGDRLGYLWIQPYRPVAGRPVPWLVVALDGPILGTVDLPEGFRPTDIGDDYILGVIRDDLDVEHVRLYHLARAG